MEVDSDSPDDLVAVGQVAAAHGVRGWLKIRPYSAPGEVLLSTRTWWLTPPAAAQGRQGRAFQVTSCREGGSHLLAQLEGVFDRDAALALRGHMIWVPRASFPAPEPDEYYWVDLIGCRFYSTSGAEPVLLGEVDEVLDNGAHAVLQVALGDLTDSGDFRVRQGPRGRPSHVLVPFVAAHVSHVDLAARRIDGDWPADF
ncbi:Ribosome maturation factor RimM OS=Castellaniella defragrans OX=75697 GN=rimM PE=3 SV=1 [Castellaniella defragrans]